MANIPLYLIPSMAAVVEMVQSRKPIEYYNPETDTMRDGPVDIRGFSGDRSDVSGTSVTLMDSMSEWSIPLMSLAEWHHQGMVRVHTR